MKNTIGELSDAMGQRIVKTMTNKNVTMGDKFVTTYYMRDPQGSVLAVYEHKHGDSDNGTFTLAEQHLYGAGRLGMRKRDLALNATNTSETPATYYELTNHLGNVMAVISDKASTTDEPTVVSLSDYYPYGMTEPGRSYSESDDYRYGYTGHEKENDIASGVYTTKFRLLDTRLGRWLSVDPLYMKSPSKNVYNYCSGNPMALWDPDGRIDCINGNVDVTFPQDVIDNLIKERIQQNPDYATMFSNHRDEVGVATTTDREGYHHPFLVLYYPPQPGQSAYDQLTQSANCFGISFAGGQVFFATGHDAMQVIEDECELATGGVLTNTVSDGSYTALTGQAHQYQPGDLIYAQAGDIIVFFDENNVPYHAAEIKSIRIDKENGMAIAELYHKNGSDPASINRWQLELPKNPSPDPFLNHVSDNTVLSNALNNANADETPKKKDVSYRVYRYRNGIKKPNDVLGKSSLERDNRVYTNGSASDNVPESMWGE
ncbi:MAG: hypothetical protein K6F48_03105 [Paludibacteraceae bacterium]|nr:hypothetical protein [Paludibacteraceae bacterium]